MKFKKLRIIYSELRKNLNHLVNALDNIFVFKALRGIRLKQELLALFSKAKFVPHNDIEPVNLKIIELFALTSGKGLDELATSLAGDKVCVSDPSKYFFAEEHLMDQIIKDLDTRGFYTLESVIPQELCAEVVRYALLNKSQPRSASNQTKSFEACLPTKPYLSARYDFSPNPKLIFENQFIQELIFDPFLFKISQEYLGGRPYLDPIELWWLFPFDKRDSNWAEDFHFDMDTIKWLKFFINFEDVQLTDGPHIFLEGTHRSKGIPWALLKKRYKRLTDEEVFRALPHVKEQVFTVPAGSILIEDTRGLHKGLAPISGRRLLLSFQYSNVYVNHEARPRIDNLENVTDVMATRIKNSFNSYDGHFTADFVNSIRK